MGKIIWVLNADQYLSFHFEFSLSKLLGIESDIIIIIIIITEILKWPKQQHYHELGPLH